MCLLVLGLCCLVLFCSVHVRARVFLFVREREREREREKKSSGFLRRGVEATRWRKVDDTRQWGVVVVEEWSQSVLGVTKWFDW
ncbi:hypothetical protein ACB094_06G115700 [Castanea mollissima]